MRVDERPVMLHPRLNALTIIAVQMNPCRTLILLAFVLLEGTGCSTAQYRAANVPSDLLVPEARHTNELSLASMSIEGTSSSQVGVGDLVEITVASGTEEEIPEPMQARVSQQGTVSLPLVGDVQIAGLEPYEAGQRIAAAAIERDVYRQPSVVLRVAEPAVNRVTVLGAVKKPGVYELPRGASDLLSAVAAAGGMMKTASTQLDVLRHERPTFLASLGEQRGNVVMASYDEEASSPTPFPAESETHISSKPLSPPASRTERIDMAEANPRQHVDYTVGDRDVVVVRPLEKRLIHVSGLVNTPNQFELPSDQDVRVLDAIAMAGGVKSPVANKVLVIRQLEGMTEPAVIEVSLSKAKKNGNENLRLAAGDMVSVESTVLTSTVDAMSTFFRVGLSLGGNVLAF